MQRFNLPQLAPELYRAVFALETAVRGSGLDEQLLHLVRLRASQLNGCAFCIDMHVSESLADGIPAQKLHLLSAWRESSWFDTRERAALAWTEAVTLLADTGVPDAAYDEARAAFSDEELSRLTVAIATINVWNRIAVSTRMQHPEPAAAA